MKLKIKFHETKTFTPDVAVRPWSAKQSSAAEALRLISIAYERPRRPSPNGYPFEGPTLRLELRDITKPDTRGNR